jgi:hypothetical protein
MTRHDAEGRRSDEIRIAKHERFVTLMSHLIIRKSFVISCSHRPVPGLQMISGSPESEGSQSRGYRVTTPNTCLSASVALFARERERFLPQARRDRGLWKFPRS